jgi:hypothetical protein
MSDPLLSLALTTGLLGSGHCLGMCGGLVAALALTAGVGRAGLAFQLLYHAGRLVTYGGIGALAGWLGSAITCAGTFSGLSRVVLLGSDLFVILVGLGSVGLWRGGGFAALDGAAQPPLSLVRALRRLPPALAAFPLGLLLGFLPCGFLYAVALTAAQSASVVRGGSVLLAFGIGTVPALFLFGGATQWLGQRARSWMLRGAGATVALMGGYNLLRHLQMLNG